MNSLHVCNNLTGNWEHITKVTSTFVIAIIGALFLLQWMTPTVQANPDTIIDSFNDTEQTVVQMGVGSTFGFDDTPGTDILGGERDVTAVVTNGTNDHNVAINSGGTSGRLDHSQDASVRGRTIIVYDGDDDTSTLSFGLGSTDLSPDEAFVIELIGADLGVTATITYYTTDATQCSTLSLALPQHSDSNPSRAVVFPYNAFVTPTLCTGGAASISDVDAIVLEIDGSQTSSADVTIDLFKTATLDYGDLPEGVGGTANFNMTSLSNDGAGHILDGLYLGAGVDSELDGQSEDTVDESDNDDTDGNDDEDGVVRNSFPWASGGQATLDVTSSGVGCLAGWIDFGDTLGAVPTDQSMAQAGDYVIQNYPVITGTQSITIDIPTLNMDFPPTGRYFFARFRLYPREAGNVCNPGTTRNPTGQAMGGEVEDYFWDFEPTAVSLQSTTAHTPNRWIVPVILLIAVLVTAIFALRRRKLL